MANLKVIIPIVVVVLALIVVGAVKFLPGGEEQGEELQPTKISGGESPELTPASEGEKTAAGSAAEEKATGDIDDAVNAISAFSTNEESFLFGEDDDASLITSDSQAIGDFEQSYDEGEF